MFTARKLSGALLLCFFLIQLCLSSPGDDLDEFEDCTNLCEYLTCYEENKQDSNDFDRQEAFENGPFQRPPLPLHLRALLWTCEQNCDYQCQQIVTKERIENGEEVLQFHGKWPFRRIFGVQEVASTIFSLGNLLMHLLGLRKILEIKRNASPEMKLPLLVLSFNSTITILAWVFSSIFHIRDFLATEALDYFFAGLTVLSGFHYISFRYFRLFLPSKRRLFWSLNITCATAYIAHLYRMITDWLYTYNMQVNILFGILQYGLWTLQCYELYSFYYFKSAEKSNSNLAEGIQNHIKYLDQTKMLLPRFFARSSKVYSLYPLLLSVIVVFGMMLEIFDFPPILFDLVDAHSLWHLTTIVATYYGWYNWMLWDISENITQEHREKVKDD